MNLGTGNFAVANKWGYQNAFPNLEDPQSQQARLEKRLSTKQEPS